MHLLKYDGISFRLKLAPDGLQVPPKIIVLPVDLLERSVMGVTVRKLNELSYELDYRP